MYVKDSAQERGSAREWEEDYTMRLIRANLHKSLCGLLVALAFMTLPLPALADDTDTSTPAADTTTTSAAATDTSTAASTPALTLADTATSSTASSLQTTPAGSQDTKSLSLSDPSQPATNTNSTTNTGTAANGAVGRVENTVASDATSGSATVADNRKGGDATTGTAKASATVVNVANTNGATAGQFNRFTCDITADTHENLVIDPSSLLPICQSTNAGSTQAGASTAGLQTGASLTEILNNIVLTAVSGNASVSGNRTAGNASTGDASALANIVNIANTSISAKNSFLGIINVYGKLTGDILVPQSLVDSLIKNNGTVATNGSSTTNIANNIDASALSGNALVEANRNAGNATTGDATTSLTVMNLTGQEVVAKNSLLVFVNVLGKWMGLIVPAPGSNTAVLGSGVQSSAGAVGTTLGGATTTNITNNVTVHAASGDASVTDNRTAGNATSGRASAGVNLLNITNSNFRLGDWFGALFINVLGSWLGNFNIQAAIAAADPGAGTGGAPQQIVKDVQVYQFASTAIVTSPTGSQRDNTATTAAGTTTSPSSNDISTTSIPTGAVLGTSTAKQTPDSDITTHSPTFDLFSLAAIVMAMTMLIALSSLAVRRWYTA
jgi:hypothetical protein